MDVTCPRCQTDYEFDDALVSERGTTVKCTNCGHQFRVFRPRASTAPSPELWRIERKNGEPLELRSLVELQRAIRAARVSREDSLRRGEGPARRVGDIPELEPFFPAPRAESGPPNTLPLPTMTEPVVRDAPPRPPAHTPAYGANKPPSAPPPPPPTTGTIRPGGAPPPPPARNPVDRIPGSPRLPTPIGLAPPPGYDKIPSAPPPRPPPPRTEVEIEPPTVRRTDTAPRAAVPAREESIPPREESYESMFPPPKRKRGGATWLVVLVVLVGVGVLGATVGKPYWSKFASGTPSTSGSASNDRLARELSAGDRAATDGDWAGAREAYLKATVVDDKSLAAWDGLCTAESELAMAHWIAALAGKSTLERDQAASVGASAGASCARWSEIARQGPDGTKKVSGDLRSVRAVAAQFDGAGVRVYIPGHPGNPIVEALAYLADVPKNDEKALAAANKSAQPALARAEVEKLTAPGDIALVAYGAGSAGNPARLQLALAELAKKSPRHMLLETLRAMGTGQIDAGVSDAALVAAADAGAHDAKPGVVAAVGTGGGGGGGGEESPSGDYRSLNEKGHKALAAGEVAKAETYFRGALAQHPGDVDALYGLGQIARSKGDHASAISYFKQVLDTSAGFAPARLALADEQWATGDQASAKKNYELYLERVSEGSGADRARLRTGKDVAKPPEPKPEDEKP